MEKTYIAIKILSFFLIPTPVWNCSLLERALRYRLCSVVRVPLLLICKKPFESWSLQVEGIPEATAVSWRCNPILRKQKSKTTNKATISLLINFRRQGTWVA